MLLVGKSEKNRGGERQRQRERGGRSEGRGNGAAFIYELWERDPPE